MDFCFFDYLFKFILQLTNEILNQLNHKYNGLFVEVS